MITGVSRSLIITEGLIITHNNCQHLTSLRHVCVPGGFLCVCLLDRSTCRKQARTQTGCGNWYEWGGGHRLLPVSSKRQRLGLEDKSKGDFFSRLGLPAGKPKRGACQ